MRSYRKTTYNVNAALLCVCLILVFGCASIINGYRKPQNINISSAPEGASVIIDNQFNGIAPLVAELSRKCSHVVEIELEGYQPIEIILKKKLSGWFWGNFVLGGLVGIAIDLTSEGLYELTPKQVEAVLTKQGSSILQNKDAIYLAVVFKPEPGWKRIASLKANTTSE